MPFSYIAQKLHLQLAQVEKSAELFAEGGTVPFLARYRKEATGNLDEVALFALRNELENLEQLQKRRESILDSLRERDLLTPELEENLVAVHEIDDLEELYLPFRPKRRTRAAIAREKGLSPVADFLLAQSGGKLDLSCYFQAEQNLTTDDEVLAGAGDILAEVLAEDPRIRAEIRTLLETKGRLSAKGIKSKLSLPESAQFRDYFDFEENAGQIPSHRYLAVMRGAEKGILSVQLRPDKEEALQRIVRLVVRNKNFYYHSTLLAVIEDAYSRLLLPSLENQMQHAVKERSDREAIRVFAENLREILLEAPLGAKRLLAVDPGFRTGCKSTVLDENGNLLNYFVLYPDRNPAEAAKKILRCLEEFHLQAVAVGNGTGGRETEQFLNETLKNVIPVVSVNESGASIYSASDIARQEFPDLDLTFRSSVSIGRRLQDPLSELIKIDPKSIGVGQYQHDVDQDKLKQTLNDVVTSCVNRVGVELNHAGVELLGFVSGLGEKLARNIVEYRRKNGPFRNRQQLLEVKGLGPKAFKQCAGFLLIRGGDEILDSAFVHPESYPLVRSIAAKNALSCEELLRKLSSSLQLNARDYLTPTAGLTTVTDILQELAKPGRDPRISFQHFSFDPSIHGMEDVKQGMKLPGIVTNVTQFGAFVDIGAHQDGLIHISKLAGHFVKDPSEIVKVRDKILVTVLDVDLERKRISLSLID